MPRFWDRRSLLLAGCGPFGLSLARAARGPERPACDRTDLFVAGAQGYAFYRIPGLVATRSNILLAYAEARRYNASDWGSIDIVIRRSTDRGRSWSAQRLVARLEGPLRKNPVALERKLAPEDHITYNNPVAIADRSGVVHFLFCLEYMRVFYMRSADDGCTFSSPVEITAALEPLRALYDWRVVATGPGHGIQLHNGRLLAPVWLSLGTGSNAHSPSVVSTIFSDDGGRTWRAGDIAVWSRGEVVNPNESAAIERSDGSVVLNVRSPSPRHRRLVTVSPDGAGRWSPPEFVEELLEPVCMAGLLRLPWTQRGRPLWVFSNPANLDRADGRSEPGLSRDRRNLTLRLSRDEGRSWPVARVVDPSFAGYSDLAATADGWIYLLYERGFSEQTRFRVAALTLVRFNLAWLEADPTRAPCPVRASGDRS